MNQDATHPRRIREPLSMCNKSRLILATLTVILGGLSPLVAVPFVHAAGPVCQQPCCRCCCPCGSSACGRTTGCNHCGPDWIPEPMRAVMIPQGFAGADFRPVCYRHDRCYESPGCSRKCCDAIFRNDLHRACRCSKFPLMCHMLGEMMNLSVRMFGAPDYRRSQRQVRQNYFCD